MANSIPQNRESEVNYSAVFNAFLYSDYKDAADGATLAEIVQEMARDPEYSQTKDFQILQAAVENDPALGNFVVNGQSWSGTDQYPRTEACVFTDGHTSYVVYRGTTSSEWIDNAEGMTQVSTTQQENAARYFDQMAQKLGWDSSDNIIVCGHSKGGNKAQFTTLAAENRDLIDSCYSLDGQGFSPEAIAYYRELYGEARYEQYLDKMYSVRGENDYVSGLGIPIIPEDHTYFIETTEDLSDFPGHHEIEYMFNLDTGHLNETTDQGSISRFAEQISERMMQLPPEQRGEVGKTVMQIMQFVNNTPVGYDGHKAGLEDYLGFLEYGVPLLLYTLLFTPEGWEVLSSQAQELIQGLNEKYGPVVTALGVAALLALAPIALGSILKLGVIVSTLAHIVDTVLSVIRDINELPFVQELRDLLNSILNVVKESVDRFQDWLKGKDMNASYDQFEVNLASLAGAHQELMSQKRKVASMLEELTNVQRQLSFGVRAQIHISVQLNACIWQLRQIQKSLNSMGTCLNKAQQQYRSNEQQIVGNYT